MDLETVSTTRFMDGFQQFSKEERLQSNWKARNAIKQGKIAKPCSCELCGWKIKKLHMHHPRYDLPFNVLFLCYSCHSAISTAERRLRAAARIADLRRERFGY